ncbi:Drug transporter [Mycena kentingensis (nom. inval.)]|nr:Drug transporter [Mycena kentingensis (nom. inval.)]
MASSPTSTSSADTTQHDHDANTNGLVVKSIEDVREPSLDPRASLETRPGAVDLDDATLTRQLRDLVVGPSKSRSSVSTHRSSAQEPLYVEFGLDDPRNPVCFPRSKKWAITALACYSTFIASYDPLAASTSSAYNLGFTSMMRDLNCSEMEATVGFAVYTLGFGLLPLLTSSFSEEFGRQPLYLASAVGFTLMYLPIALARNIGTVIVARFLQGAFGSTWATMVGGTIADIWTPQERGLPMSIFSLAALSGTGVGPVWAGWVEMDPRLEWRWIHWIQMINCGAYSILVPIIMRETRSSILLTRLAKKLRKETGDNRYRARIEDERASLMTLIYISCTRPIHLLLTEPVVLSFSLWIAFLWGVMFSMVESVPGIFRDLHHFNLGQEGTVFASMIVGTILGFGANFYQERLYHKYVKRKGPEARLISACVAAVVLPTAMFVYAWCSFSRIHWISLVLAIVVYIWATFIVYLAVFSYLADCYGPFASSALAGQSLCRNIMATVFPLFIKALFRRLGYNWGNTLFGFIAAAMMPIPLILFVYGPRIREKSRFSRVVLEREREAETKAEREREKQGVA